MWQAEVDEDGNGFITLDEFISAMATVPALQDAGDVFQWKIMFSKYDSDGSGALSGEEVTDMLSDMWTGNSEMLTKAKSLIDAADEDGDGEIEWEEFLIIMQQVFMTKKTVFS